MSVYAVREYSLCYPSLLLGMTELISSMLTTVLGFRGQVPITSTIGFDFARSAEIDGVLGVHESYLG